MWRPLSFGVILSLVGCTFQLECAQITDCSTCVSDTVSTTVASTPFPVLGCAWCLKDGTCHAVGSTSNPCSSSDCISESTFSQCKKRSPGDCPSSSSWPSFSQKSDLKASPWGDYFQAVYGGLPTSYPYHVSDLWVLHDSVLISAHVTSIPDATSCPKKPLDRYNINDAYQPPQVSWIWHAYPYKALKSNSWVEVIHEQDPFGDEVHGAWMLYTPGSGIYFDVGKTISFTEHQDAYAHFNIAGGQDMNSAMAAAAAAAGFDSVQFLAHVDHVSYQCDTKNTGRRGFDYMGLEIVAVRMVGTYACGSKAGAPTSIKRGWAASASCKCDNSKQFLNCDGTPDLQTNVTAMPSGSRRGDHRNGSVMQHI